MREINQQDLKNILEMHRKWVLNEPGGERADLRSANLSSANLSSADLRSANLSSADLSSADLSSADLSSADLSSANLSSANLRSANLRYANLSSANLSYANLSSANLSSANLSSANLRDIMEDFYKVLDSAKAEVEGLYRLVWDGKIKGTVYQGECACLVGSIANLKNVSHTQIEGLEPNAERLAERWFLGISEGDMPLNSQISKITAEWMESYMVKNEIVVPKRMVTWS